MERHAWIGQALLYAAFAAVIGVFSQWPSWRQLAPGRAVVKLSLVHLGQPLGDCVPLSPQELAKLPPNMRTPTRCPRERAPVYAELDIDGAAAIRRSAAPAGLARDGASVFHERIELATGRHHIAVRLRDRAGAQGFDYRLERDVELAEAEILVVDFDPQKREIVLR